MLNPRSLFTLYRYGRDLARFDAQGVLTPLPARFLTQKPAKKKAPDLPETPAARLSLYLQNAGIAEQTAAAFFALYPDIAGRAASDQAARSSGITVPADTLEKDGSCFTLWRKATRPPRPWRKSLNRFWTRNPISGWRPPRWNV